MLHQIKIKNKKTQIAENARINQHEILNKAGICQRNKDMVLTADQ